VAELCRREGIAQSLFYRWSIEFLEAGKQRRAAGTDCLVNTSCEQAMVNELSNLAKYGRSPMQARYAATGWAAEAMVWQDLEKCSLYGCIS